MIRFLILALAGVSFMVQAQHVSPLEKMIETERAFASLASTSNTRDAFLANLISESVTVQGDTLVSMRKIWEGRVSNTSYLSWKPLCAHMAAHGDLGFTTGPWSFAENKDGQPVAFGDFVTIWKKQNDGKYKIITDIGVRHPVPHNGDTIKLLREVAIIKARGTRKDLFSAETQLLANLASGNQIGSNYSEEVQLFRDGELPIAGSAARERYNSGQYGVVKFTPLQIETSSSLDFGYVLGAVTGPDNKTGKYLHIWRREGDSWKVILDLVTF